jgi:hypothetical protein
MRPPTTIADADGKPGMRLAERIANKISYG